MVFEQLAYDAWLRKTFKISDKAYGCPLEDETQISGGRDFQTEGGRGKVQHRFRTKDYCFQKCYWKNVTVRMVLTTACASTTPCLFVLIRFLLCRFPFLFCLVCSCLRGWR